MAVRRPSSRDKSTSPGRRSGRPCQFRKRKVTKEKSGLGPPPHPFTRTNKLEIALKCQTYRDKVRHGCTARPSIPRPQVGPRRYRVLIGRIQLTRILLCVLRLQYLPQHLQHLQMP